MGFEDLVNRGREALGSEQGEQRSDQAITGAGDTFDKLTGGRFAGHTDGVQARADGFIGQSDQQDQPEEQGQHEQQPQQDQQQDQQQDPQDQQR